MRTTVLTLALALTGAAAVAAPTVALSAGDKPAARGGSLDVVGLAGGTLVGFRADAPDQARALGTVTGLAPADPRLVGIDYRVQDGLLYGVGSGGGIYTLSTADATATRVGQLTVPLEGTSFGVDFNPAANALRVVSDTGQNLRQPFATPGTATVTDTPLTTPPSAARTTGVVAAAYTNNDLDPTTATTLFDLGTETDQVLLQAPANSGTLSPTGSLGVDATGDGGFDIATVRNGPARVQVGVAVLQVDGASRLYEVDLLSGAATALGTFASAVTDVAVPLAQR